MGLFRRKKEKHIMLRINAPLQPIDRGCIEDPICEALEACGCGYTEGGGTMLHEGGGIAFCEIKIYLKDDAKVTIDNLLRIIDEIGVPKGSFLKAKNLDIAVGRLEGLALHLNGTDLPDEVYKTYNINHVAEKMNELLKESGKMYSHWEWPQKTSLYFYGTSFETMKEKIKTFVFKHPLCQKCEIEKTV